MDSTRENHDIAQKPIECIQILYVISLALHLLCLVRKELHKDIMMNHFSDQEVDELSNVEDRIEKCEALLAKKGEECLHNRELCMCNFFVVMHAETWETAGERVVG